MNYLKVLLCISIFNIIIEIMNLSNPVQLIVSLKIRSLKINRTQINIEIFQEKN